MLTMIWRILATLMLWVMMNGFTQAQSMKDRAAAFLEGYNQVYQALYTVSGEATWKSMTDVKPEHTGQRIGAEEARAAFVGSPYVIETARAFLQEADQLEPLQVRQLRFILRIAAEYPGTLPDVVSARVAAEARQSAALDAFEFTWTPLGATQPQPITANGIDQVLSTSTNLQERRAVWEASKQTGPVLKPGLLELRDLRNRVAREMGHSSFYALQVDWFDMGVPEMRALCDQLVADLRPLYEQLHCWARHELARRYGQPVPKLIPAHWLNNRWSQEWPGLVEGIDLDPLLKGRAPRWIAAQAVAYGESLGLPDVPDSFWRKSDLYELPEDATRKKNTHASAWSINLKSDVRSLMNIRSDFRWFVTAHHELGHIFYQLAYARPEIPMVLREGASPAMHEAMAEALATPVAQLPYLRQTGVVPPERTFDETQWLLNLALDQVVFIPWSAGVMRAWEEDFYEQNLPADQLNARWWKHVAEYQGVAPPSPRGEEFCDAATKTHINDNPAQYYKYAIAFAIKWQLHMHLAQHVLQQDPRHVNLYGNAEAGEFLLRLMRPGATKDWRALIREATGEDLSARPMLEYFEPLMAWLKKENAGRETGW